MLTWHGKFLHVFIHTKPYPLFVFKYFSDTSALNKRGCIDAHNNITDTSVPGQILNTDINGSITEI